MNTLTLIFQKIYGHVPKNKAEESELELSFIEHSRKKTYVCGKCGSSEVSRCAEVIT